MIAQFVDVFGFIAVLLRGLNLALTSIAFGGIVYIVAVLRRFNLPQVERRVKRSIAVFSTLLACVQAFWLLANTLILVDTTGLAVPQIIGASFFQSGAVGLLSSILIASVTWSALRLPVWLTLPGALLVAANVATTHAVARLEGSSVLLAATAVHHTATAVWVGALPFWLLTIRRVQDPVVAQHVSRRFSRMAMIGFSSLVAAGIVLSIAYVRSPTALYGTNYGVMVAAKILLTALIMVLAGLNYRLVHSSAPLSNRLLRFLRPLGEAEVGIAFTVVLAAASLTSQPPAVDLTADRVDASHIADRFTPRLPRLSTPPVESLSPSARQQWKTEHADTRQSGSYIPGSQAWTPPTQNDIAWSEYNHHWAGLVVLAVGLLAVLSRSGVAPWARHWPLMFLALAVFLLLRADPETWPLGPDGFWESFSAADVAQHRLFVLLIVLFALFEWGVQTGRLLTRAAAFVFPGVCATGGALLLTHTHALSNVREELLAELSHLPLAILGVTAGWTRWLELRLPEPGRWIPSRVWPVCFVLIGVVLLLYREA